MGVVIQFARKNPSPSVGDGGLNAPVQPRGGTPLQHILGLQLPTNLMLSDSETGEWVRTPGPVECLDGRVIDGMAAYDLLEPHFRQWGISLEGITQVDDVCALWQGLWNHKNFYRLGAGVYVCNSHEKFMAHFEGCRFVTRPWLEYIHYVGTSNFPAAKAFADKRNLREQCIRRQKLVWAKWERDEKSGKNKRDKEENAALVARLNV